MTRRESTAVGERQRDPDVAATVLAILERGPRDGARAGQPEHAMLGLGALSTETRMRLTIRDIRTLSHLGYPLPALVLLYLRGLCAPVSAPLQ